MKARCSSVYNNQVFDVIIDNKVHRARRHVHLKEEIYVGDYVQCENISNELFMIELYPRQNTVIRMRYGKRQYLAANIDIIFIVTNPNNDFNLGRLERYYVIGKESGARICFVISKCDLTNTEKYLSLLEKRFENTPIVQTTIFADSEQESAAALYQYWLPSETAIFLGSSGVGKSSLINAMLNREEIKTNTIRDDDKGRHTTTARHLYTLDNGRVIIDTPGLRSVGINSHSEEIDVIFSDIKELERQCRFSDCTHINEPGCAILTALENDSIHYDDFIRYCKLKGNEVDKNLLEKGKAYEKMKQIQETRISSKNRRMK